MPIFFSADPEKAGAKPRRCIWLCRCLVQVAYKMLLKLGISVANIRLQR